MAITLMNNAFYDTVVAFGSDGNSSISDDHNDWGVSPLFQTQAAQFGFSQ